MDLLASGFSISQQHCRLWVVVHFEKLFWQVGNRRHVPFPEAELRARDIDSIQDDGTVNCISK